MLNTTLCASHRGRGGTPFTRLGRTRCGSNGQHACATRDLSSDRVQPNALWSFGPPPRVCPSPIRRLLDYCERPPTQLHSTKLR